MKVAGSDGGGVGPRLSRSPRLKNSKSDLHLNHSELAIFFVRAPQSMVLTIF